MTTATAPARHFYPGQKHVSNFRVSDDMIWAIAQIFGDANPIHTDDEYAAQTPFKGRISQGVALDCIVSRVLGMEFPGTGTVYMGHSMDYRNAVRPGDEGTIEATITELLPKNGAQLRILVKDAAGNLIADGVSRVKLPRDSN